MARRKPHRSAHAKEKRAAAFADDMIKVLEPHLGLVWQKEPRTPSDHECVDVIGKKNDDVRVLIEVELRRIAPLGNVVKVWKRVNLGKYERDVIMFQAFSAFYPKKGTLRANAEFVGKEMHEACGVRYFPLSMKYRPAKQDAGKPVMRGGGRRQYHAKKLANTIIRRLRKIL